MPGRHASADNSRFRRDLTRLIVLVVLAVVVAVAAFLIIDYLRSEPEDPLVAATTTSRPETVATAAPSTTAPRPTTTVAATTSTVTTVATTVPETTSTLPPVRSPDRLTVLVLNATRVAGLAGRVSERLADLGYRTLDPDNHPEALQTSVIWYVGGFAREAEVLAEAIPDAEVQPFAGDDPRAPLTVVLGASYRE